MPRQTQQWERFQAYWWFWLQPHDWLSLWWNGRVDGRRQLPAWAAGSEDVPTTPQLQALSNEAGAWFQRERLHLEEDLLGIAQRGAALQSRIALLARRLEQLSDEGRVPADLTPDEREQRRTGEADLDITVVRRRRQREHDRTVEAHLARTAPVLAELEQTRAELSIVPEEVEERRRRYEFRTVVHRHLVARRAAFYWRSLVRQHARGTQLAAAWRGWTPELALSATGGLGAAS